MCVSARGVRLRKLDRPLQTTQPVLVGSASYPRRETESAASEDRSCGWVSAEEERASTFFERRIRKLCPGDRKRLTGKERN